MPTIVASFPGFEMTLVLFTLLTVRWSAALELLSCSALADTYCVPSLACSTLVLVAQALELEGPRTRNLCSDEPIICTNFS